MGLATIGLATMVLAIGADNYGLAIATLAVQGLLIFRANSRRRLAACVAAAKTRLSCCAKLLCWTGPLKPDHALMAGGEVSSRSGAPRAGPVAAPQPAPRVHVRPQGVAWRHAEARHRQTSAAGQDRTLSGGQLWRTRKAQRTPALLHCRHEGPARSG